MRHLRQNLRYALRVLCKSPGFTAVAVISLALGIGANAAIFTLVNALLLRDLPVWEPERLVELAISRLDGKGIPLSYPMFKEIERGQLVFSDLMGWAGGTFSAEVGGVPSQHKILAVTGNYYSGLGVVPLFGRLLTPEDVNPHSGTTSQVAVIGYRFWQQHLANAPDVIGRQIRIEGHSFTIVGVTRKWFTGMTPGEPPDISVPITAYPAIQNRPFSLEDRSILWVFVTGRLKAGVDILQARSQLRSFWPGVLQATASTEIPGPRRQRFLSMGLEVTPVATGIAKDLRAQFTRPLYVLWGIVGVILLVACVNLANLMLARASTRTAEMSVRVALGASRRDLTGQVLTETLILSLGAAVLGIAFSYWGSRLLVMLMSEGYSTPVTLDLSPDARVLTLTIAMAVLTGILIGLMPAWRSSRQDPAVILQQTARSLAGGVGYLGKTLIVTQVGLSLVLLLGGGLLVRTFQQLRSVDLGFVKESLLEMSLYPKPDGYQNAVISCTATLSGTDPSSAPIAICTGRLRRGILSAGDLSGRMPLRARSLFLALVVLVVTGGSIAWAQAPATTKKPNSSPAPATAPASPQSKHFPILLLASGNNPAWSLRIGQKGPERLDRPGYPPIALEPAEVEHDPSGQAWTYHAKDTAVGVNTTIHLSREACSDGMSATKFTFNAVVEHPQLGTLKGCARIAAELFPRIINQSEDDSDDAAKKKTAPETTITGFKVPTAVAYVASTGKTVVSRGAVKKVAGPAGTDLALSHDGKKLLYVRADPKAAPESAIVLFDFDTGRSRDLVHGAVRQSFWSLDDARIAYPNSQDQKWQIWTLPAASPETPAPLYTGSVSALQGWVDTHLLLATDLQNAYWIADDGNVTQTVALRDIYGTSFEVRESDTLRVNPGNPDLLLVSANYTAGPLGTASTANRPAGGIFLYELRSKRRTVLTPPDQSASNGEWSRDGVQVFYTVRASTVTSTYRVFWDGSASKRYITATNFVIGQ